MDSIRLYTVGFTKKSAEQFFELLLSNQVRRLVDTRVNNASQLAGFAKGKDLRYFCKVIGNIEYQHRLDMAPTQELLREYRMGHMNWSDYTDRYIRILEERELGSTISRQDLHKACLLCSEHLPDQCHRSLLANYLRDGYPEITISHLI